MDQNKLEQEEKDELEFFEAIESEEDLKNFRKTLKRDSKPETKKGSSSINTYMVKRDTQPIFNPTDTILRTLSKDYNSNEEKFQLSKSRIEEKIYKKNSAEPMNLSENIKSFFSSHNSNEFTFESEGNISPVWRLKTRCKKILVKTKGLEQNMRSIGETLYEVQIFAADKETIWTAKVSLDNKYLAVGGKSGILKIYEFCNGNLERRQETNANLKLIDEENVKELIGHQKDIIDLSWASNNPNLILSGSLDHFVILWDVSKSDFLYKFDHTSLVTCVCFCPNNDDSFVSGCLDKIIRVFSTKKKAVLDYLNVTDLITAVTYSPDSESIVVGYHNGKCDVYSVKSKLKLLYSFECKNKYGKFSKGRKVTSVEFINKHEVIVATNDSRLRLFSLSEKKTIHKYKGLTNEDNIIRPYFDENSGIIISASDDGNVFLWKKEENSEKLKINEYEYFAPFSKDSASFSFILNEALLLNYQKKFFTEKLFVKNVIVNSSKNGKIQVLVDVIFLDEK